MKTIFYVLSALIAVAVPIASALYVKKKLGGKLKYFFGGVGIFLIFYVVLYAGAPLILTSLEDALENLKDSPIIYNAVDVAIRSICVALGYFLWFKLVPVGDRQENALMTGVGFGSSVIFMAYAVSNAVNAVLSLIINGHPRIKADGDVISQAEGFDLLSMVQENIYEVKEAAVVDIFLGILQMLCFFVLEVAVAYVFYRVLVKKNRPIWIFAALLLKIAGYTVAQLGALLQRYWIVLILIAVSIVISGAAYALYKPFVPKKEENLNET